jgi:hypothetical protein
VRHGDGTYWDGNVRCTHPVLFADKEASEVIPDTGTAGLSSRWEVKDIPLDPNVQLQFDKNGYVLLWASVLQDYVAYYNTEDDLKKVPEGFIPYHYDELVQISTSDLTDQELQTIHMAKRVASGRITSIKPKDKQGTLDFVADVAAKPPVSKGRNHCSIQLPIRQEFLDNAFDRYNKMPFLKNSIRKNGGIYDSFVMEEAIAYLWKGRLAPEAGKEKFHSDMKLQDKNGKWLKVEIKTTTRTVAPKNDFQVHIAKTSDWQNTDLYVFCSTKYDKGKSGFEVEQRHREKLLKEIWVVGQISREDFFNHPETTFRSEGSKEPDTGWVIQADEWALPIRYLAPLSEIGECS